MAKPAGVRWRGIRRLTGAAMPPILRLVWLLGVLMLLFALVMVDWSVQNWTQFQYLLHDAP